MSRKPPSTPRPTAVAKAQARKGEPDRSGKHLWNLILVEVVFTMTDRPEDGAQILKIQFPEKTDFRTFPSHRIERLMNVGAVKVMEGFPQERHQYFRTHDVFILQVTPLGEMTDAEFWAGHEMYAPAEVPPSTVEDVVAKGPFPEFTDIPGGVTVAANETPAADNVVSIKSVESPTDLSAD